MDDAFWLKVFAAAALASGLIRIGSEEAVRLMNARECFDFAEAMLTESERRKEK
jgi:hypothetical protein